MTIWFLGPHSLSLFMFTHKMSDPGALYSLQHVLPFPVYKSQGLFAGGWLYSLGSKEAFTSGYQGPVGIILLKRAFFAVFHFRHRQLWQLNPWSSGQGSLSPGFSIFSDTAIVMVGFAHSPLTLQQVPDTMPTLCPELSRPYLEIPSGVPKECRATPLSQWCSFSFLGC